MYIFHSNAQLNFSICRFYNSYASLQHLNHIPVDVVTDAGDDLGQGKQDVPLRRHTAAESRHIAVRPTVTLITENVFIFHNDIHLINTK